MSKLFRLFVTISTILGMLMGTGLALADVSPPEVIATLAPGESLDVTKTVDVPEAPPKADIYFLADTTGSMGAVIANVKMDASTVLNTIRATIADVQFGAGQYKDFPFDTFAFSNDAPIGPDDGLGGASDASDAIDAWFASGGVDGSEGQLFALDRIADPADPTGISWRPDSSRILVWFGDAPGHDPVCSAISGLPDITETSATTKLVDAGITVVAISTTTGFPNGLDDDPTIDAGDYIGLCPINGTAGQATRIAAGTSGVHLSNVSPSDIADAILEGIEAITLDITAEAVGCDPLIVSFDPPIHEDVVGPNQVQFVETIEVPAGVTPGDLPPGGVVNCSVEFKASGAVIGTQNLQITVPITGEKALVIDHEGLLSGSIVDSVSVGSGISVEPPDGTVSGSVSVLGINPRFAQNAAMIYDSTNLTGDDDDLFGFADNVNLLIVSEDLDQTDPDDNKGGTFEFDFSNFGPGEVMIQSLEVFDIDPNEAGGTIVIEKTDSSQFITDIPITGNKAKETVSVVNGESVQRMIVTLMGSGAIDNIRFLVSVTPQTACVDFEPPLAVGTQFGSPVGNNPGDVVFTDNNIPVSIQDFVFIGGGGTFNVATIDAASAVFGIGQTINTNNINLEFDFSGVGFPVSQVDLEFLDLGGFENLSINGSSPVYAGELSLAPTPLGGVDVAVTTVPVTGGQKGTLTLTGSVQTLQIGGQEFWMDNVCAGDSSVHSGSTSPYVPSKGIWLPVVMQVNK